MSWKYKYTNMQDIVSKIAYCFSLKSFQLFNKHSLSKSTQHKFLYLEERTTSLIQNLEKGTTSLIIQKTFMVGTKML